MCRINYLFAYLVCYVIFMALDRCLYLQLCNGHFLCFDFGLPVSKLVSANLGSL